MKKRTGRRFEVALGDCPVRGCRGPALHIRSHPVEVYEAAGASSSVGWSPEYGARRNLRWGWV